MVEVAGEAVNCGERHGSFCHGRGPKNRPEGRPLQPPSRKHIQRLLNLGVFRGKLFEARGKPVNEVYVGEQFRKWVEDVRQIRAPHHEE
jgi:hypothetical protein